MPLFPNATTSTEVEPVQAQVSEQITEEEIPEEELNLPSVEIIIEDGSGVSDSNVYCDLDYALEYCVKKGYSSWTELSEDEQKIYLIRGTEFIDNFFEWKGKTKKGQYQSLAFPREDIFDDRGFELVGIPDKLKRACIEAAFLNSTSGTDTLFSTKDENGNIKRQKVDTLEVEYFNKQDSDSTSYKQVDYTSIYDILNKLLKGLYKDGESSRVCSKALWSY